MLVDKVPDFKTFKDFHNFKAENISLCVIENCKIYPQQDKKNRTIDQQRKREHVLVKQ